MIQQGTLSPVTSMEDAFGAFEAEMGATPEDYTMSSARPVARGPEGPREPEVESEPVDLVPEFISPDPPANPYALFGSRIIVHGETGLITKPYPMRTGRSADLMGFMTRFGDFPMWDGEGVQSPETITMEILGDYDTEYLSNAMRAPGPAPGKDVKMGDWLVVTAGLELMQDVEHFINTFAGGPPQIEIEAKIVEYVARDVLDLGVASSSAKFPDHTLFEEIGWAFPNQAGLDGGGEMFAGISSIHDGVTYAAMFEAMANYENVSIVSRPKVAVRDGVKAKIEAITKLPYLKVSGINTSGNPTITQDYEDIGVKMYVTPRLVGTGTIALQIDIEASQQTGDAVTFAVGSGSNTQTVSTPVISTRTAETLVYLKPRQAVILGGLISERSYEEETGIPLLKDLPLLGYLFKSTREGTEKTTLLFFIRPRLIEGTDFTQPF